LLPAGYLTELSIVKDAPSGSYQRSQHFGMNHLVLGFEINVENFGHAYLPLDRCGQTR
jgi:hypothetical protein